MATQWTHFYKEGYGWKRERAHTVYPPLLPRERCHRLMALRAIPDLPDPAKNARRIAMACPPYPCRPKLSFVSDQPLKGQTSECLPAGGHSGDCWSCARFSPLPREGWLFFLPRQRHPTICISILPQSICRLPYLMPCKPITNPQKARIKLARHPS